MWKIIKIEMQIEIVAETFSSLLQGMEFAFISIDVTFVALNWAWNILITIRQIIFNYSRCIEKSSIL